MRRLKNIGCCFIRTTIATKTNKSVLDPLAAFVLFAIVARMSEQPNKFAIKRLAKAFAEQYEQPWFGLVAKRSDRLGSNSRWVASMPNDELLSLKR